MEGGTSTSALGQRTEQPEIAKIKKDNHDVLQLATADVVKSRMAKAFQQNPNPVYQESYIKGLEKAGYDRAQLTDFANTLNTQEPDEHAIGVPAIENPQPTDIFNKATNVIGGYVERQGQAAEQGAKQMVTGMAKATDYRSNLGDIASGSVNAVAGGAKTAFAVANLVNPEMIAFSAATEGVHALPDNIKETALYAMNPSSAGLSKQQKSEQFDKLIDLPFAAASTMAEAMAKPANKIIDNKIAEINNKEYSDPKQKQADLDKLESLRPLAEGSGAKAVAEIFDIIFGGALFHKATESIPKKTIKNSETYLKAIDKVKNGTADNATLKELGAFTEVVQNMSVEDIHNEALKQGKTDIANTISEANKVPHDDLHTKLIEINDNSDKLVAKVNSPEYQAMTNDNPLKLKLMDDINNNLLEKDAVTNELKSRTEIDKNAEIDNIETNAEIDKLKSHIDEAKKANEIETDLTVKAENDKIINDLENQLKTQENAIQKPSTERNVPLPGATGETITEGGEGVRQGIEGVKTPEEIKAEEEQNVIAKQTEGLNNLSDAELDNIGQKHSLFKVGKETSREYKIKTIAEESAINKDVEASVNDLIPIEEKVSKVIPEQKATVASEEIQPVDTSRATKKAVVEAGEQLLPIDRLKQLKDKESAPDGGLTAVEKNEKEALEKEFAKDKNLPFSLSQERIDYERVLAGEDRILKTSLKGDEEILKDAIKKTKDSPELPMQIAEKVISMGDKYNPTAEEQMILGLARVDAHHEKISLLDKKAIALENGLDATGTDTQLELNKIKCDKIDEALSNAGSMWGKVGRIRQKMLNEEYSFINEERILSKEKGAPLNAVELAELKKDVEELQKVLAAQKENFEKIIKEQSDKARDLEIKLQEESHKKSTEPKPKRENRFKLTDAEQKERDELRIKFSGKFHDISGFITLLGDKDFLKYGKLLAKEVSFNFVEFSKKAIDELGDKVKPILKDWFDKVQEEKRVEENKSKEEILSSLNKIKNKADFKKSKEFRGAVKKLAKEHFGQGLSAKEIVSNITKDLIDSDIAVSERDVQDGISGYGLGVMSKKQIDTELNNLKSASLLSSKILDSEQNVEVKRKTLEKKFNDEIKSLKEKYKEKQFEAKIKIAEEGYKKADNRIIKDEGKIIEDLKKKLSDIRKANNLSEEARNDKFQKVVQKRIDILEEKLKNDDFSQREMLPELIQNLESKKLAHQEALIKRRFENRRQEMIDLNKSKLQKFGEGLAAWHRDAAVFGIAVYGKLALYDLATALESIPKEILHYAGQKAFPKLYETSITQKPGALKEFAKTIVSKEAMKGVAQTLKSSELTEFETEFGSDLEKQFGKNFIGRSHLAVKMPLLMAETKRSFKLLLEDAQKNNKGNALDEFQIKELKTQALAEGHDAIMLGNNLFSKKINQLKAMANNKNATNVQKVGAFVFQYILPVDKIPTNYAIRGAHYSPYGLIKGVSGAIKAERSANEVSRGIGVMQEKINGMSQQQATSVVKLMERGLIGTAAIATAFIIAMNDDKREKLGGMYYKGRKQAKQHEGDIYFLNHKFAHNFEFNSMQLAATGVYAYEDYMKAHKKEKKDASLYGKATISSLWDVLIAQADEIPSLSTPKMIINAVDGHRINVLYDLINSNIPNASKEAADMLDYIQNKEKKDYKFSGEIIDGYLDNLQYRMPFIRQEFIKHKKTKSHN